MVQKRARKGAHGHWYDPSSQAKKDLGWELLAQREKAHMPILGGDLAMEVVFYGLERGDIDNALKALLDAGNGILWEDDKQFVGIEANVVRKAENPRTEFVLKEF